MTGLTADVNRRNFSAACPGPPPVGQFTIWNLRFTSGRQKETNRFLQAAKQPLHQNNHRRTGLAVENFVENSGRVCVVR